MRNRIWFATSLAVVLALLILALGGCAGAPAPTPTPSKPVATAAATPAPAKASPVASPAASSKTEPAASKEPYKIGALAAVTGPGSSLGIPERNTYQMLEEQVNKSGGINGHPVQVVIRDTESDETKAVLATKKLIEEDKVLAILGPSLSGESLAIADTVTKAEVPLISAAASIMIVVNKDGSIPKWVFKTPQSDALIVKTLVDHLKTKGYNKIGWLSVSNAYGDSGTTEFQKLAPSAGLNIVAKETFAATDTDMTAQLTRVKGANPDAIVVWSIPPSAAIVSKNAAQLGIKQPVFQSHGIGNKAFMSVAGPAANGVVFPAGKLLVADALPDSDAQKKVLLQYTKDYTAKFGADTLSTFGGHAWDCFWVVADALKKSGPDRAKLRDAIENTKDFVGITGVFSFSAKDHNGLDNRAVTMVEIKDGKWVPAK
ncbi:MAG: ABC transporter substrate-binding protein [Chloroflexi bacterium]|nr:ABC transporter substrate-binding protein [Chloroflexota bacterium]MDA8188627.1 ABC transporter substrate-binding protein [Dehalococcoidales bacterium]